MDFYVGITDYAQKESGRIDHVELLPEGKEKKTDESFGLLYGSNRSIDLLMPFAGRVLLTNPEIIQCPFLINVDAYNYWIAVISIPAQQNLKYLSIVRNEKDNSQMPNFLSAKEYRNAVNHA